MTAPSLTFSPSPTGRPGTLIACLGAVEIGHVVPYEGEGKLLGSQKAWWRCLLPGYAFHMCAARWVERAGLEARP